MQKTFQTRKLSAAFPGLAVISVVTFFPHQTSNNNQKGCCHPLSDGVRQQIFKNLELQRDKHLKRIIEIIFSLFHYTNTQINVFMALHATFYDPSSKMWLVWASEVEAQILNLGIQDL